MTLFSCMIYFPIVIHALGFKDSILSYYFVIGFFNLMYFMLYYFYQYSITCYRLICIEIIDSFLLSHAPNSFCISN